MQPVSCNPYLGVGLYSVPSAARYLHVSTRKLRSWAEGYTYCRAGERRSIPPVKGPESPELEEHRIISFQGLVELMLVKRLREEGVSLPSIRYIADRVRDRFHVDHPLAIRRLYRDGKKIFAELRTGADGKPAVLEDLKRGQLVFAEMSLPYLKNLDFEDDWAVRYWPLGKRKGVRLDPQLMFGAPIVGRKSVPTYVLAGMVFGGTSIAKTAWWYEVPESDVRTAVEYEKGLQRE